MKNPGQQQSDEAIADLLAAVAEQYRLRMRTEAPDANDIRFEIIRKLELIRQSIKGLMKHRQQGIDT